MATNTTTSQEQPVPERPKWSTKIPDAQYDVILFQLRLDYQTVAQKRSDAESKAQEVHSEALAIGEKAKRKAERARLDAAAKQSTALKQAELKHLQNMSTLAAKPCDDASVLTEAKKAMYEAQWLQAKRLAETSYNAELARIKSVEAQDEATLAAAAAALTLATTQASEAEKVDQAAALATFYKALHDALEKLCK